MPVNILRLRHWLAAAILVAIATVAGAYFYARYRVQNALRQVPEKIAEGIQQSAEGFTFSKSEQGRTLFKVQARKVVQFKQGGLAELRDVTITFYGPDSSRFDQIYGSDFNYDPHTGDVSARGEVQIDLEANPTGSASSDQSTPRELKNPIHLKTSGLVFNQNTQDAHTDQKVEFRIPQASGSVQGLSYSAKTRVLTLQSQINLVFTDPLPATLVAARGTITRQPRLIVLQDARLKRAHETAQADETQLLLRADNNIDGVKALGHVLLESEAGRVLSVRSGEMNVMLGEHRGELHSAVFSGGVEVDASGSQAASASAGRVMVKFAPHSIVTTVHAEGNVKLLQRSRPGAASGAGQNVELTAPAVDLFLASGRRLLRAETSPGAEITLPPAAPANGETHTTATKFVARFDAFGQLASLHGAPQAQILSRIPGKPDRVSTSRNLDIGFTPGAGIDAVVQQGDVVYSDGELKAWADGARYTPADQMVRFSGSPRVAGRNMTTTGQNMRLNRLTGQAFADGDVKTTYGGMKSEAEGALLASSSPVHVTAQSMIVNASSGIASYSGAVRLWQDANVISASALDFDRDRRTIVAKGSTSQPVLTTLVQADRKGVATPVSVTSSRLTYVDAERRIRFEADVSAKAVDFSVLAHRMDVFLKARGEKPTNEAVEGGSQLERIVAEGNVRIDQTTRHAQGDRLTYTAADDKFVLSGGPPSIFDAEHGKITGVSLTLFRSDDRVLVEGRDTSPSVTQTRVAR